MFVYLLDWFQPLPVAFLRSVTWWWSDVPTTSEIDLPINRGNLCHHWLLSTGTMPESSVLRVTNFISHREKQARTNIYEPGRRSIHSISHLGCQCKLYPTPRTRSWRRWRQSVGGINFPCWLKIHVSTSHHPTLLRKATRSGSNADQTFF